jgi:hypothetical protein
MSCPICTHNSHSECAVVIRARVLAEVIKELEGMHPSIDAAQAATDLKQTYASDLLHQDRDT